MKRICVVVDNDLVNDERVNREINLIKNDYDIHVLCYGYKTKSYKELQNVTVHRIWVSNNFAKKIKLLNNTFPIFESLWKKNLTNIINEIKPSVLHVHDLYMSDIAHSAIKKSKFKIPFVLDLHENYPAAVKTYNWTKGLLRGFITKPGKWKKIEKRLLSYPDKIIVLSENFKDQLQNEYTFLKSKEIIVVPNVLDLNSLKNPIPIDLNFENLVFLYFGVIAERRGVFTVINAFKKLVNNGQKANLLLIGPVDKADKELLNNSISSLETNGTIKYIPWINLSDLKSYMDISDVGLAPFLKNPQHESGIANKIYQYMYGSLALLASDCKPQMDLINQEEIGLIFQNEDELIEKMKFCINNPVLIKKMGSTAKKALLKKYNIELFKEKVVNCFQ